MHFTFRQVGQSKDVCGLHLAHRPYFDHPWHRCKIFWFYDKACSSAHLNCATVALLSSFYNAIATGLCKLRLQTTENNQHNNNNYNQLDHFLTCLSMRVSSSIYILHKSLKWCIKAIANFINKANMEFCLATFNFTDF